MIKHATVKCSDSSPEKRKPSVGEQVDTRFRENSECASDGSSPRRRSRAHNHRSERKSKKRSSHRRRRHRSRSSSVSTINKTEIENVVSAAPSIETQNEEGRNSESLSDLFEAQDQSTTGRLDDNGGETSCCPSVVSSLSASSAVNREEMQSTIESLQSIQLQINTRRCQVETLNQQLTVQAENLLKKWEAMTVKRGIRQQQRIRFGSLI